MPRLCDPDRALTADEVSALILRVTHAFATGQIDRLSAYVAFLGCRLAMRAAGISHPYSDGFFCPANHEAEALNELVHLAERMRLRFKVLPMLQAMAASRQ